MSMHPSDVSLPLERDLFLRTLLRHLAGTLEQVVGVEESAGYVSLVGQRVGEEIDASYRKALGVPRLDRDTVAAVLVDLKRRIRGEFRVESVDEEKIVLVNAACPFGDKVLGRPSLCMMTSNVFGFVTAENLGYAKVSLEQTIAAGAPGCRVVVWLKATPAAEEAAGREYFATPPTV